MHLSINYILSVIVPSAMFWDHKNQAIQISGRIQDHDLAMKDNFFPFKQCVNVTGLITLEMRLKPGFVQL